MKTTKTTEEKIRTLHESAKELNAAMREYRAISRLNNQNLPRYEYLTKGDKTGDPDGRPQKSLNYHPTKKVARSNKRKPLELALTAAIIRHKNAESAFTKAENDAYAKN